MEFVSGGDAVFVIEHGCSGSATVDVLRLGSGEPVEIVSALGPTDCGGGIGQAAITIPSTDLVGTG